MSTVGPAQTLIGPDTCVYLPPKSTVAPKSTASIVGTIVIYSGIPQIQGLPSVLRGFNPLLLGLHGDISLCLLWSHSPWGSVLVLVPPLCVGCPQASVPCPGKRKRKELLFRGCLLIQAWGREEYGSHGWDVKGVSEAAEASVKLQEPEACHTFSQ